MMAYRQPNHLTEEHLRQAANLRRSTAPAPPPTAESSAMLLERLSLSPSPRGRLLPSEVSRLGLASIESRMVQNVMAARMQAASAAAAAAAAQQQHAAAAAATSLPRLPPQAPLLHSALVSPSSVGVSPGMLSPGSHFASPVRRVHSSPGRVPHSASPSPARGLELLRTVSLGMSEPPLGSPRRLPRRALTPPLTSPSPSLHRKPSVVATEQQQHELMCIDSPVKQRRSFHQRMDSPVSQQVQQQQQSYQQPPPSPLPSGAAPANKVYVDEIREWDVMCGRGGRSNHHAGNKRYRHVVSEMKMMYRQTEAKAVKTDLSRAIVDHVCNYGGRFIKKEESSGRYYVLTKAEARKKTSQALRETKELKWTA